MLKKSFLLYFVIAAFSLGIHFPGFTQPSSTPGIQKRISDFFTDSKEAKLIEPERAFRLQVAVKGPTTLIVDLIPARGYYLYRDRIKFSVEPASGVSIKSVKLPPGKVTNDPTFGRMETYEQPVQAEITLARIPSAKNFTLAASYQGCHKPTGVCYPPINKTLKLVLP